MSTKRLSRTIIERGKRGSDKEERRQQIIKSRQKARIFCATYCEDKIEPFYEARHYYREFGDRLAALYKFLEANVGKPWNDVFSKLCAIRSRKTIQGHHFIEHAKGLVFTSTGAHHDARFSYGFYIEDGILYFNERWRRPKYSRLSKEISKRYEDWIGNRKIRLVGSKYFWCEPVTVTRMYLDGVWKTTAYAWRQNNALNDEEIGHMKWLKIRSLNAWEKVLGYR